jgi:hypothetical protein
VPDTPLMVTQNKCVRLGSLLAVGRLGSHTLLCFPPRPQELLAALLSYHVVPGVTLTTADLTNGEVLQSSRDLPSGELHVSCWHVLSGSLGQRRLAFSVLVSTACLTTQTRGGLY